MFIKGAGSLHDVILSSIMHSKLGFFEATPTGRILNRFSKDIESTEISIPLTLKDFFSCLFNIISIVFLISHSTPFFLVPFFILIVVYLSVQVIR
jgi:ATP-binding cassette, subfamily C (CFTR/MRP), member 1